jgi:hypothetical protein
MASTLSGRRVRHKIWQTYVWNTSVSVSVSMAMQTVEPSSRRELIIGVVRQ